MAQWNHESIRELDDATCLRHTDPHNAAVRAHERLAVQLSAPKQRQGCRYRVQAVPQVVMNREYGYPSDKTGHRI